MRLEPERRKLFADRLTQAATAKFGQRFGLASRLAEMSGVSIATAGRWLRGSVTPGPERWPELAVQLGVNIEWLTGSTHEMPEQVAKNIPQDDMNLARRATKVVIPAVLKLERRVTTEEIDRLVEEVYHLLEAGYSDDAVTGVLFKRLY